ncbi:hypothetical protein SAMN05216524_109268 [Mucilaginibacter sp. OK098]|nr:hypothetical protein SAMN05216524_109268 [Mucilaginibacter sp. OK098]
MKKPSLKPSTFQKGEMLTREQMKNVMGGGITPPILCFRCCPSDPCSPIRHMCPEILCGEI